MRRAASSVAALALFSSCGGGPETDVKDTVKSYGVEVLLVETENGWKIDSFGF